MITIFIHWERNKSIFLCNILLTKIFIVKLFDGIESVLFTRWNCQCFQSSAGRIHCYLPKIELIQNCFCFSQGDLNSVPEWTRTLAQGVGWWWVHNICTQDISQFFAWLADFLRKLPPLDVLQEVKDILLFYTIIHRNKIIYRWKNFCDTNKSDCKI